MNIFLCGQKEFGKSVFNSIRAVGHLIIAGVSAPLSSDRRPGKPDKLRAAAESAHIPVIPSGTLSADTLPSNIDLIVCAHSHDFVSRKTRLRARLGAIGYHPSLLPLHRGRDAIRWAIKQRDRVTGGSVYWLTDTVDGGPIAAQEHVFIRPGDDAQTLWRRDLFPLGVRLLTDAVQNISAGIIVQTPQDESCATWEPSLSQPPLRRPDLYLITDGKSCANELQGVF